MPKSGHGSDSTERDLRRDETAATQEMSELPAAGLAVAYPAGTTVGRYTLEALIGSGGMGSVYRARDPQLERAVAIKLLSLTGSVDDEGVRRDRLLREAQALAQLSHPNIVAIHDVGAFGDEVFLAMELVDGRTVRDWLRDDAPARADILRVFVAAGEGLAAAHRAGIVHRDFKPGNIMLGDDGRVRVVDFGLARGADDAEETASIRRDIEFPDTDSHRLLTTPLTEIGGVLGTPAYMSPEQYEHEPLGTHSDQFAFCVSLYEALCGTRPFVARGFEALREAVRAGEVREPAAGEMPRWIWRIVRRGLSRDPDERYPTMTALLADLRKDPAIGRRRAATAVAVAALGGVEVFGLLRGSGDPGDPCAGVDAPAASVWSHDARMRLDVAVEGSRHPHGTAAAAAIGAAMDRFVTSWRAQRIAACRATSSRAEQSAQVLDLRMRCLDRKLDQVGRFVALVEQSPEVELIDRAPRAIGSLGAVDACTAEAVLAEVAPPGDPDTRARVEAIEAELDRAQVVERAGRYADALAIVATEEPKARAAGHPATHALALYRRATLETKTGRAADGERTLYEALAAAADAGDRGLVAQAWVALLGVVGVDLSRGDDAAALRRPADIALRLAGDPPRTRARYHRNLGTMALYASDIETADREFARYAELTAQVFGPDHLETIAAYNNLGAMALESGRYDEAKDYMERAIAATERTLGPHHPDLSFPLVNLGLLYEDRGDAAEALALYERALAIDTAALGPAHPEVARGHDAVGSALSSLARYDEAIDHHQQAYRIRVDVLGPDHVDVAWSLSLLGTCYTATGRHDKADEVLTRALAIREARFGPEHAEVAQTHKDLADLAVARGRADEARRHYDIAADVFERVLGADNLRFAWTVVAWGRFEVGAGQAARARPLLERGLAVLDANELANAATGRARLDYATAMWSLGKREAANAAAIRARAVADVAADADRWLAAHPR